MNSPIYLSDIPWYWAAMLVIFLASVVAVGGLLIIRRLTNPKNLRKDQEIASYSLNTIALLYCVIVGFVVIRVQERHAHIKDGTVREANLLLNLYYSSCDVFSIELCAKIKNAITEYAHHVIEKEWPHMVKGEDISLAFPQSVHLLWMVYDEIEPKDNGQAARYAESLSRLNDLTEARFVRLSNVGTSEGAFMWTVLIYGGLLVTIYSCLFASNSLTEHLSQLIFTTSFIALVLLLIYSLDSPYSGPTAISSKPFEHVLELIDSKHRPVKAGIAGLSFYPLNKTSSMV